MKGDNRKQCYDMQMWTILLAFNSAFDIF